MNILAPDATVSIEEAEKIVILVTNDGKRFSCPRDVMCSCVLISELLEDADDSQVIELPLPSVDHVALSCVYEFLDHKYHHTGAQKELERPLRTELKSLLDGWQWKFIEDSLLQGKGEKNNQVLFSVMNAANFLGIAPLVDLCGAAIANMIRNKSEQEILDLFDICEPFTRQQEDELCRDFPWLRERPS